MDCEPHAVTGTFRLLPMGMASTAHRPKAVVGVRLKSTLPANAEEDGSGGDQADAATPEDKSSGDQKGDCMTLDPRM